MKVLNFGSLNLDYVYQVEHFVQPGETLSAIEQTVNPGGKGLNQSIALARAGGKVHHAGNVGFGGENLAQLLYDNGIDTTWLLPSDQLQGNAVIQVTPSGENCILLFGGSNQCISEEQIENTITSFSKGDWIVLQNEINNLPLIVNKAYEQGLTIALNPSPYNKKLDDVDFHKVSWLLVNEVEAEQISGKKEPEEAWKKLHEVYPELSMVITLGSAGSVSWQVKNGEVEKAIQRAFPVHATDTTGAGDTYTGYFICGLLEGRPLQECMKRASMASALSVTKPGAANSIPQFEEVEKALAT